MFENDHHQHPAVVSTRTRTRIKLMDPPNLSHALMRLDVVAFMWLEKQKQDLTHSPLPSRCMRNLCARPWTHSWVFMPLWDKTKLKKNNSRDDAETSRTSISRVPTPEDAWKGGDGKNAYSAWSTSRSCFILKSFKGAGTSKETAKGGCGGKFGSPQDHADSDPLRTGN